jgi:magnesium transporter
VLISEQLSADLTKRMDTAELLAAAEGLDLDDLAHLIQKLLSSLTKELPDSLDSQRRRRLESVHSYAEDTAGGIV